MTPIRITLDGRPGTVINWEIDGRDTFALIDLDNGRRTFCRWPSPRIEAAGRGRTEAEAVADLMQQIEEKRS